MERTLRSWILSGVGSVLVAIAAVAAFTFVWSARGVTNETRDFVSFAAFVVFVVAFNEGVHCFHQCGQSRREKAPRVAGRHHGPISTLCIGALLTACGAASAAAQQTIFNLPNADVLDRGKTYLETDVLWRPSDPSFGVFTVRVVYGLGGHVEAGVNFGGFQTPGRSTPIATPNVKWQPVQSGPWTVTAGVFGLFYLRGATDGDPAALGYGHVAVKLPTGTRLTAGGYWASSGYAAADVQKGALAGLEQPVGGGFTVAADWFGGKNGLGYFSPGLIWSSGPWTLYGAWSLKNDDSRGNAALFEAGFTF
jgi:hypothetical protein